MKNHGFVIKLYEQEGGVIFTSNIFDGWCKNKKLKQNIYNTTDETTHN